MKHANTAECLDAAWKRWREADFGWTGLARSEWKGWVVCDDGFVREGKSGKTYGAVSLGASAPALGRTATLQDYWRADPATGRWRGDEEMGGELVSATGQTTYHRCHLPIAYGDGSATGKAFWEPNALDQLIRARLEVAAETQFEDLSWVVTGTDFRARFDGGVWLQGLAQTVGSEPTAFVTYMLAMFVGPASFKSMSFGEGDFVHSTFCGRVDFEMTSFPHGANFLKSTFCSGANFGRATFEDTVGLIEVNFRGDVTFENIECRDTVICHETVFNGAAVFDSSYFGNGGHFDWCHFLDRVSFAKAIFGGTAGFRETVFADRAEFKEARLEAGADFSSSIFERSVSFQGVLWPNAANQWHSMFDQAHFKGPLNVSKAGFQRFAAFAGAVLEGTLQIDEVADAVAERTFAFEREMAIRLASVVKPRPNLWGRWKWWFSALREWFLTKRATPRESRRQIAFATAPWLLEYDARLKELERGCRVLKLAMERASNKSREQLLYRFELLARRAQRGLPLGEALVSDLYGAISNYGASLVRPLAALGVGLVLFAALFWGIAAVHDRYTQDLQVLGGTWDAQMWSALDYSWANVFKPLSALADGTNLKDGSMMKLLLTKAGDGWAFGVRLAATLQSIVSLVLAFLFALAVRRRFQMS